MNRYRLISIILFMGLIYGNEFQVLSGDIIQLDDVTRDYRTCPEAVDSCLYVCGEGETNPCHPENIYSISIDTTDGSENSTGSRFRIHFPWEYEGLNANKFRVTASSPALSPTAVFAWGDYAYWDVIGNEALPGTVQGSVWYGSDCQDSLGNIGSDDCLELVGRFCFAPGDTLDWPEYMDQSIANDVCNGCWVSFPAWESYDDYPYSDSLLSPGSCDIYDHCHINPPDSISCGIGYLDGETVSVFDETVPLSIRLKPNYPNPFNPVTTIQFDIPAETQHAVSLQVYDISGRMVETLVNEKLKPGQHEAQWNASDRSSGLYFLKMETGHYIKTQKMILLK